MCSCSFTEEVTEALPAAAGAPPLPLDELDFDAADEGGPGGSEAGGEPDGWRGPALSLALDVVRLDSDAGPSPAGW